MQHLPSPAPETRGCDARRTLISYNHAILFSNEKKKKPIEVAGISMFFALVFHFAP